MFNLDGLLNIRRVKWKYLKQVQYLGLLTMATKEQTEAIRSESFGNAEKRVKKWNFRRL